MKQTVQQLRDRAREDLERIPSSATYDDPEMREIVRHLRGQLSACDRWLAAEEARARSK